MTRAHWLALLLFATSGCLGGVDECDRGATRCNAGNPETCENDCSDFGCHDKWQIGTSCSAAQSCIVPSDTAPLCAESPSKDPRCVGAENATYCAGNDLVQCQHGYRVITRACGSVDDFRNADLPGGSASTRCVDPGDGTATCIPEAAKIDALCDGVTGPLCEGTALVECVDQHAVFKTVCASCVVDSAPACTSCPPNPRGVCRGYLGDGCAADADCAVGLVCHDDNGNAQRTCSLPCTVETTADTAAGTSQAGTPNPQCYSAFNPDVSPISAYSEVAPAGRLSCIAGYCKWAP
jgi:hypothetical protein